MHLSQLQPHKLSTSSSIKVEHTHPPVTVTGGLPPWLVEVWNVVPPAPVVEVELEAEAPGPEV